MSGSGLGDATGWEPLSTGEGVPPSLPQQQERLPCEDHLLYEASSLKSHGKITPKYPKHVNQALHGNYIQSLKISKTDTLSHLPISQNIVIGIDIGTTPCGVALVSNKEILFSGVRLFESPVAGGKTESRRKVWTGARATRRRLRSRRQRLAAVRAAFSVNGLPDPRGIKSVQDLYATRAEGLERRLTARLKRRS